MASNNLLGASMLALALCFAVVTPCYAQPSEVSATDKETARQLMDSGDEKFDKGDFEGALKDFQGADAIMNVTSTGYAVGKTLARLGKLIEARDKLLAVMRMPPVEGESKVLADARVDADRLQKEVADRIPALRLKIQGVPENAEVTVNIGGQPVPRDVLSLPRTVDPGTHQIEASCPGYQKVTIQITVNEGQRQDVMVSFKPATQDTPVVEDDDGVSPLVIAGFAVGGVGIIVGAITGGVSLAQASDVKDQCTNDVCPTALEEDKDSSVMLAHVSTASFIIGGLGVAVGVVGLILDGREPVAEVEADSGAVVRVEPLVGLGSVGLRGRF